MTPTHPTAAGGRFGVVLTVADHEQNGFVALAKWRGMSETDARLFLDRVDASIPTEAEPDIDTDAFTFILDLTDGQDTIDNGKKLLPTQVAMSLAPDQVQAWLNERPDPDSVCGRPIPNAPRAALAKTGGA